MVSFRLLHKIKMNFISHRLSFKSSYFDIVYYTYDEFEINMFKPNMEKGGCFVSFFILITYFLAHQTEIATLFAWVIKLHLTQVFSPRLSAPKKLRKTLK